jgi:nucleotide-binding universal stress UspA family protein
LIRVNRVICGPAILGPEQHWSRTMINKILLAYDGSENAQRALDVAAELAAKLDADLIIAHVLMHGRPTEELRRMSAVENIVAHAKDTLEPDVTIAGSSTYDLFSNRDDLAGAQRIITFVGEQLIAHAKDRAESLGAKVTHTNVGSGDFADEIMDAADAHLADMIVVGSRGLGPLRGAVLGSVSQKVLHYAGQAVLAVK